uniref:C2H2-type domain-containing protein n=1 Tax=Caenorhabditis japonica TaxID=281687 RepID=A0A8R1E427_CAEJA
MRCVCASGRVYSLPPQTPVIVVSTFERQSIEPEDVSSNPIKLEVVEPEENMNLGQTSPVTNVLFNESTPISPSPPMNIATLSLENLSTNSAESQESDIMESKYSRRIFRRKMLSRFWSLTNTGTYLCSEQGCPLEFETANKATRHWHSRHEDWDKKPLGKKGVKRARRCAQQDFPTPNHVVDQIANYYEAFPVREMEVVGASGPKLASADWVMHDHTY